MNKFQGKEKFSRFKRKAHRNGFTSAVPNPLTHKIKKNSRILEEHFPNTDCIYDLQTQENKKKFSCKRKERSGTRKGIRTFRTRYNYETEKEHEIKNACLTFINEIKMMFKSAFILNTYLNTK